MAEEREVIRIDIDDAKALLAARRTNDQLERLEKRAGMTVGSLGRVADSIGDITTKTVERQRAAIERSLVSLEKRVANPLDILRREQQQYLKIVGGDQAGADRVNKVFAKLISDQEKVAVNSRELARVIASPLTAAETAVEGFASKFGKVGAIGLGVAAGIGAAALSALHLVDSMSSAAEQTVNLSDKLGVSVGEVSVLEAQAKIAGVSVDALSGLVRKLSNTLTDSGEESRAAVRQLEAMGVSVVDTRGQFRDSISILRDFSLQMGKIPEHAKQVELANQVFGKGAVELLPLIKNYADLETRARALGVATDEGVVRRLAVVNDKLDAFGISWDRLKLRLAEGIVGTVEIVYGTLNPFSEIPKLDPMEKRKRETMGLGRLKPTGQQLLGPEQSTSVGQGDELVERFRSRSSVDALRTQLKEVQRLRAEVETKIVKGVGIDQQRKNIAEFQKLDAQATTLSARLKEVEQMPDKLKAAHELAAQTLSAAVDAQLGPLERLKKKYDDLRQRTAIDPQAGAVLDQAYEADLTRELTQFQALRDRATEAARRNAQEGFREAEQEMAIRLQADAEVLQNRLTLDSRLRDQRVANARDELTLAEQNLRIRHDAELRALEGFNATTLDEKIAVEQQKAEIEAEYLQQSLEIKKTLLDAEYRAAISSKQLEYEELLNITAEYTLKEKALVLDVQADIDAARQNAQIRSGEIMQAETQRSLDTLQRQAEGVFDAMIRTWRDGWSGAGAFLQTILLTAFKNVATSQIVKLLSGVGFGGGSATGTGAQLGGGRGLLGLLGLGGAQAAFGAASIGPGGTAPFNPAASLATALDPFKIGGGVSGPASSPAATIAKQGPGALLGGYKEQFAQYTTLLSKLGNLGVGKGMIAKGITGVKGGGMLLGGGLLFADGLRRGGLAGLGETTAGGALIGAKFGGPIGALIGGAIGFGAGLFGLFRSKAEDKIVKRVREMYGFDVEKKFAKDQLLPIIKQQFGGDIEMGLRSQPVRELIELYAMSRGLNTKGIVARANASVSASRGGTLQNVSTFTPSMAAYSPAAASSLPVQVNLQLDGPTTQQVLQGQAVEVMQDRPRLVSRSADKGQQGRGSRSSAMTAMVPNFVG